MKHLPQQPVSFGNIAGMNILNKFRDESGDIIEPLIELGDKITREIFEKSDAAVEKIANAAHAAMMADPHASVPVFMIELSRQGMLHLSAIHEGVYLALKQADTPSYLKIVADDHYPALLGSLLANAILGSIPVDEIPSAAIAFNSTLARGRDRAEREREAAQEQASEQKNTDLDLH